MFIEIDGMTASNIAADVMIEDYKLLLEDCSYSDTDEEHAVLVEAYKLVMKYCVHHSKLEDAGLVLQEYNKELACKT